MVEQNAAQLAVERLVLKLEIALLPEHEPSAPWFDWQSLPLVQFFSGMSLCMDKLGPGRHKFLDVGSGIGTKLFLADCLGFEAHGIERRQEYVDVSKRLWPEYPVKCMNALEYETYDKFDVIYSYRLGRQDDLQTTVNKYIVDRMKRDAIFFSTDTPGSIDEMTGLPGVESL